MVTHETPVRQSPLIIRVQYRECMHASCGALNHYVHCMLLIQSILPTIQHEVQTMG